MAKLNDVLPDALAGMIKEAAKQSGLKANLAFVQKCWPDIFGPQLSDDSKPLPLLEIHSIAS